MDTCRSEVGDLFEQLPHFFDRQRMASNVQFHIDKSLTHNNHWMMGTWFALRVVSSVKTPKVAATQFSVNLLIRSEPAPEY
jgi:imidazoleglycerol phosphate dehydratase HisB